VALGRAARNLVAVTMGLGGATHVRIVRWKPEDQVARSSDCFLAFSYFETVGVLGSKCSLFLFLGGTKKPSKVHYRTFLFDPWHYLEGYVS
jgi:hypothetical protein